MTRNARAANVGAGIELNLHTSVQQYFIPREPNNHIKIMIFSGINVFSTGHQEK